MAGDEREIELPDGARRGESSPVRRMPPACQGARLRHDDRQGSRRHSISSATPTTCGTTARGSGCTSAAARVSSTCSRSRTGIASPVWRASQRRPAPERRCSWRTRTGCISRCRIAGGRRPKFASTRLADCTGGGVLPARCAVTCIGGIVTHGNPRGPDASAGDHCVFGNIVASARAAPGGFVTYFSAESTIWSMEIPSSRACTRSVCGPDLSK